MVYVGRIYNPIMLYHASSMASKISSLNPHHLKDLQAWIRFGKKRIPILRFKSPHSKGQFSLEATSDASMFAMSEVGGFGAFIIMRRIGDISHPIYWSAWKLRRITRISSTAELLAASNAVNALIYLQHLIAEPTYHHPSSIFVD